MTIVKAVSSIISQSWPFHLNCIFTRSLNHASGRWHDSLLFKWILFDICFFLETTSRVANEVVESSNWMLILTITLGPTGLHTCNLWRMQCKLSRWNHLQIYKDIWQWQKATWLRCSEAYLPTTACCSCVNLPYCLVGLHMSYTLCLLQRITLLKPRYRCRAKGCRPESTGVTVWKVVRRLEVEHHASLLLPCVRITRFSVNFHICKNFIFVSRGFIRNVRKFALFENFPLYGTLLLPSHSSSSPSTLPPPLTHSSSSPSKLFLLFSTPLFTWDSG